MLRIIFTNVRVDLNKVLCSGDKSPGERGERSQVELWG